MDVRSAGLVKGRGANRALFLSLGHHEDGWFGSRGSRCRAHISAGAVWLGFDSATVREVMEGFCGFPDRRLEGTSVDLAMIAVFVCLCRRREDSCRAL